MKAIQKQFIRLEADVIQRKDCYVCSSRAIGHKLAIFPMQMFIFCQDIKFNFSSGQEGNDLSIAHATLGLCFNFFKPLRTYQKYCLLVAVQYFAVLYLNEKPTFVSIPKSLPFCWFLQCPRSLYGYQHDACSTSDLRNLVCCVHFGFSSLLILGSHKDF